MNKYEFTGQELYFNGRTLKRIRRISDGLIGGWIEGEHNLSQSGDCFVYSNAKVTDRAVVADHARVEDRAVVTDNARVTRSAWVRGIQTVTEDTQFLQFPKYDCTITDSLIQWGCHQFMIWDLKQFELEDCIEEWDADTFYTCKKIILEAAALKWGVDL